MSKFMDQVREALRAIENSEKPYPGKEMRNLEGMASDMAAALLAVEELLKKYEGEDEALLLRTGHAYYARPFTYMEAIKQALQGNAEGAATEGKGDE